jgi:hypothetical protein
MPISGMPTAGVLGVTTLLGSNSNINTSAGQSVVVGYKYGLSEITAFASVSESLSVLGTRTDEAPLPWLAIASMKQIELRVFVDGHIVETFFGGNAVISTVTGNTIASPNVTSTFLNTANLQCTVHSWVLGL